MPLSICYKMHIKSQSRVTQHKIQTTKCWILTSLSKMLLFIITLLHQKQNEVEGISAWSGNYELQGTYQELRQVLVKCPSSRSPRHQDSEVSTGVGFYLASQTNTVVVMETKKVYVCWKMVGGGEEFWTFDPALCEAFVPLFESI